VPTTSSTVFSPVGVLPLLAVLADAAAGPARDELAGALGVPVSQARALGLALLKSLPAMDGITAALGVWLHPTITPAEGWTSGLPSGTVNKFSGIVNRDQRAINAWAKEHTRGMIPRFPLQLPKDALVVLASAVSLSLLWAEPFDDEDDFDPDASDNEPLWRRTHDARIIRAMKDVTAVTVKGKADVDLVLVLGHEDRSPRDVLSAGLEAITGGEEGIANTTAAAVEAGNIGAPGLTVKTYTVHNKKQPPPDVDLTVPPFRVSAEHNLLDHRALFGLDTASRPDIESVQDLLENRHFPGITSSKPLYLGQAGQEAVAEFTAKGFTAAAITYASAPKRAAPRMESATKEVARLSVEFNRQFGFSAVEKRSKMVLFTDWVTEEYFRCKFNK